MHAKSLILSVVLLSVQTTFRPASPAGSERFQQSTPASYNINVCSHNTTPSPAPSYHGSFSSMPATPVQSSYHHHHQDSPYADTSSSTTSHPMDSYSPATTDQLQSTIPNYPDSPTGLPSFQDTYNIHGTYTTLYAPRDDKLSPPGTPNFQPYQRDDCSPNTSSQDKFSSGPTMHYQGQYQAYPVSPEEMAYVKQNAFPDNPDYFQKMSAYAESSMDSFQTAAVSSYSTDQKETLPFQGTFTGNTQSMYTPGDRQSFAGYASSYFDGPRVSSNHDSNFGFPPQPSVYRGDINVQILRQPFHRPQLPNSGPISPQDAG